MAWWGPSDFLGGRVNSTTRAVIIAGRSGKRKGHPVGWPVSIAAQRLRGARARSWALGDPGDVRRRSALVALDDVELDPLTLGEALESRALDGGVVHEAVLAPVLRRDETEALAV